jgi:hypothetical protein
MFDLRLGDEIDDYCVKCRRLTNHAIVSLVKRDPAKVRCRTCYHEHDFRKGEAPPKKDAKKEALFKEVLSTLAPTPPPAEEQEKKKPKARKKSVE